MDQPAAVRKPDADGKAENEHEGSASGIVHEPLPKVVRDMQADLPVDKELRAKIAAAAAGLSDIGKPAPQKPVPEAPPPLPKPKARIEKQRPAPDFLAPARAQAESVQYRRTVYLRPILGFYGYEAFRGGVREPDRAATEPEALFREIETTAAILAILHRKARSENATTERARQVALATACEEKVLDEQIIAYRGREA